MSKIQNHPAGLAYQTNQMAERKKESQRNREDDSYKARCIAKKQGNNNRIHDEKSHGDIPCKKP
jgi:hypothetical protein